MRVSFKIELSKAFYCGRQSISSYDWHTTFKKSSPHYKNA